MDSRWPTSRQKLQRSILTTAIIKKITACICELVRTPDWARASRRGRASGRDAEEEREALGGRLAWGEASLGALSPSPVRASLLWQKIPDVQNTQGGWGERVGLGLSLLLLLEAAGEVIDRNYHYLEA